MQFVVTSDAEESVQVVAEDWGSAMQRAMAFLDVDAEASGRWHAVSIGLGTVMVGDPGSGRSWTVREADAPDVSGFAGRGLPVAADMRQPDELAERLFELSFELGNQDATSATSAALEALHELIPCEASSVLRGTLNDIGLTFVAATGPVAANLLGRSLRWGKGLAGACFTSGRTIQSSVANDWRHLRDVDADTGFTTRMILCVPIRNDVGVFGVVQLLNPPGDAFAAWQLDTVETIARALAGNLAAGLVD